MSPLLVSSAKDQTANTMNDEEACLHALQYVNCRMLSNLIDTAIELDIFGIIANAGPGARISSWEIASKLPKGNPDHVHSRLDGMLRLLATHCFLTCSLKTLEDGSEERVYGLAPASKFLINGDRDEGSLVPLIALFGHPANIRVWSQMKDAIFEGGDQFEKLHGLSSYQYSGIDPTLNKNFNEAMAGISTITMRKILEVYKGFDRLTSLVDVGGGSGRILNMIISKHPSIKGINYDLPHVVQDARPHYLGIDYIGGDMFAEIPQGDAILLKDILHNWSDDNCLKLLRNCHNALPENGKVIIITMIPPKVPDWTMSSRYLAAVDYIMQLKYSGNERSEEELKALCKGSGFSKFQVACSAYNIWSVVEFRK